MKRRQFLWAFAGLVVGAGFTAGSSVTNSSEAQGVVAIIFKRLGYLKLDRQGVLQFARDYTKQHLMSAGKLRALSAVRKLYLWVPQAWFNSLMPDIPLREERIVTTFLLSSDFFPSADEQRTVRRSSAPGKKSLDSRKVVTIRSSRSGMSGIRELNQA